MASEDDLRLLGRLARLTVAGTLDAKASLPAMGELAAPTDDDDTLPVVVTELGDADTPGRERLRAHVREVRFAAAIRHRQGRLRGEAERGSEITIGDLPLDAPIGWDRRGDALSAVNRVRSLFPDWERVRDVKERVPVIHARVEGEFIPAWKEASAAMDYCGAEWVASVAHNAGERGATEAVRAELADHARAESEPGGEALIRQLAVTTDHGERQALLDRVLCLPDARFGEGFLGLDLTEAERERAQLILTMRFGDVTSLGWEGWRGWLRQQTVEERTRRESLMRALRDDPVIALLWYRSRREPNPETEAWLRSLCPEPGPVKEFTDRWAEWLSREEWAVLDPDAVKLPVAPPPLPVADLKVTKAPPTSGGGIAAEPGPVPVPAPKPSFWEAHVRPLLSENWYICAGIAMVIVGASLLAYYTWDKAWWLRYTIMPALLAVFTWALPRLADWMEGRGAEFRDTGAMLRGAAVGLLPLNFMVVALLGDDESVPGRAFLALLLGAVYLLLFGAGLSRWCGAVQESLRWKLGGSLLFLAALVALVPLLGEFAGGDWKLLGLYGGFGVVVVAVVRFARGLERAVAGESRISWFVGTTLIGTFVQSFAWLHGWARVTPSVIAYAPMMIGAGWLVMFAERRHLELFSSADGNRQRAESFLGYAFIFLGILMGAGNPEMRLAVFALAGTVWLYQARGAAPHYWIGLTLLVLAGAAAGLLPEFPKTGLAGLGVGMALALGIGRRIARGRGADVFAEAAGGVQTSVLLITTVVAVLGQWHYRSEPIMTGWWLLGIAGILLVAAFKENRLAWVHTAMAVLALTLPYFGCVDLEKRTLHGNTMVFGLAVLSFLWLGANWLCHQRLLRDARSTVLWLYGVLATTGMIVRVLLERGTPFDPLWYLNYMDYCGPLLIAVALVFAAAYSRSLIPSFMAIVIVVILFPELKANLRGTFVDRLWGTGLGSAASALGLVLGCFRLRQWERLRGLPDGDRFFGRDLFPLRRSDHTLFTWPMMVAAVVLAGRVDTWTLVQNLWTGAAGMRTAAGILLTAIVWPTVASYHRTHPRAKAGAVAGVAWLLVGLQLVNANLATPRHQLWVMMVAAVVLQIAVLVATRATRRGRVWVEEVLIAPWNWCSRGLCLIAVVIACGRLLFGKAAGDMWIPAVVFAWLLIRHGRESRMPVFGGALYLLAQSAILDGIMPEAGRLWFRLEVADVLVAVTWGNAAFLLAQVTRGGNWRAMYQPLLVPTLVCSGVVTLVLGAMMAGAVAMGDPGSLRALWLPLFITLILEAWVQRSGLFAVLTLVLGYEYLLLAGHAGGGQRFDVLLDPWRLATFAVVVIAILRGAGAGFTKAPLWLRPGANPHPLFHQSPAEWIHGFATLLAVGAVLRHSLDLELRAEGVQTWTPYLAALALGWIGWLRRQGWFHVGAAACLLIGNYHLVRVFVGEALLAAGLGELHVLCLGLGVSLAQIAVVRGRLTESKGGDALNLTGMWLGGAILSVLAANYFTDSNLAAITGWRFLFSGALALLTGWYFRQVSLFPLNGEAGRVDLARAFYHFGVTMAIWCVALLVPALRSPALVLLPLALPIFYFHQRSEEEFRCGLASAGAYRSSASILGFLWLALYAGRGAFQMVLFPDVPLDLAHYHQNAPLLLGVSLVLLRLHGLGGTSWLAVYGGVGVMVGSFFLVTWPAAWSPFAKPIAATWLAVLLAHFWITASVRPSPLRSLAQRIAGLDEPGWVSARRAWGVALTLGLHWLGLIALGEMKASPRAMAPLLLGIATVMLHQGAVRRSVGWLVVGGLELAVALHGDFLIPSLLPAAGVVWVLLGLWLGALFCSQWRPMLLPARPMGFVATGFAGIVVLHVLHHRPWSDAGLWAVLLGGIMAALNPQREREAASLDEKLAAAALPWVPAWLACFWTARMTGVTSLAELDLPCLLSGAIVVMLTGVFAGWCRLHWSDGGGLGARLWGQSLAWFRREGDRVQVGAGMLTTGLALAVQLLHYGRAFTVGELTLLLGLYGGLAWSWIQLARGGRCHWASYAAQVSVAALFVAVRRQLMLTTEVWSYEYDVWAALAVSFCMAGTKRHWDAPEGRSRAPMVAAMFVLPAVACAWVFLHDLGTDVALLVVGLYSLQFTYMGRDNRESPYNAIATFGFVAFVMISFWGKLEVRYLHAFVIPVGIGVLVLLQLFGRGLSAALRNRVRLVTLISMIGSAGYYALVDDRHPLSFNLTVIVLCLLAMGLGSLLRVRLYLVIGMAALLIDLVAIVAKVMVGLDDQARISSVGVLILMLGAGLVTGAIYYKTHAAMLAARLGVLRRRLGEWE